MNESNTPTSLYLVRPANISNCHLFGDVVATSGGGCTIDASNVSFYGDLSTETDLATRRATLGKGTYKGDIITAFQGLALTNGSNTVTARHTLGGGTRPLVPVGDILPKLLFIGGPQDAIQTAIAQFLSGATSTSGTSWLGPYGFGESRLLVNCYLSDAISGVYKAHVTGPAWILYLGGGAVNAVYVVEFTSTSQTKVFADFKRIAGTAMGQVAGYYEQAATQLPQMAGPLTWDSGTFFDGSIHYDTTRKRIRLHTGNVNDQLVVPAAYEFSTPDVDLDGNEAHTVALLGVIYPALPFAANSTYSALFKAQVTVWLYSDPSKSATLEVTSDLCVVTNSSNVATVTQVQGTVDTSRLTGSLVGTVLSTWSAGTDSYHYTQVTRPTGTRCWARCRCFIDRIEKLA
jgi:hypothetical protein